MKSLFLASALGLVAATPATVAAPLPPEAQSALAQHLLPSLVRIELELHPDSGDPPEGAGLVERCPRCGRFHVELAATVIEEDRRLEFPGILIGDTTVLMPEAQIHPRFIRSIVVRSGDDDVAARSAARAVGQPAMLLHLDRPLRSSRPVPFDPRAAAPHALASFKYDAGWTVAIHALPTAVSFREGVPPFLDLAAPGILLSPTGVAAGATLDGRLPLDDSWKGHPGQVWDWHDAAALAAQETTLRRRIDAAALQVELRFRASPTAIDPRLSMRYGLNTDDDATERRELAVLVEDRRLVVLAGLPPATTARLERILVHPPEGDPIEATFVASLRDTGAFVADLARPLPGPLEPSDLPVAEWPSKPLWLARVDLRGETRTAHLQPVRVEQTVRGPRHRLYPELRPGLPEGFLLDHAGRVLALPLASRARPSATDRFSRDESRRLTPLSYLREALADLDTASDPANAPLTEADARRMVWAGIEMESMTPDLARALGVSHLTRNGQFGGIVTAVHPDSPAHAAGVGTGWILLRLHPAGRNVPVEVRLDRDGGGDGFEFPWDRLDEVPAEYLDRLPAPWPAAETPFNRLLAQLGRGTRYAAEFLADSESVRRELQVEVGPPHFDSAPSFKSSALGLTARDTTFEVRRYLNLGADEPAVVVSKIEPGGKAAVAGLRPYEIITHLDDLPLSDVAILETAVRAGGDFRLAIRRMSQGRVVHLRDVPAE
ncbi:MAG: hypothetical protein KF833_04515 [Verrucomicrobiae bacterium]|nr:hypothetical protein [Verrucomicrobiae bacterium]